jgi:transglutaminase-like putative cysteine protease
VHWAIHHLLRLRFDAPVREIHVECQMEPRHEANQSLISFDLRTRPKVRPFRNLDTLANAVHSFDTPREISEIIIAADSVVALTGRAPMMEQPELAPSAMAAFAARADLWDFLQPTDLTQVGGQVAGFISAQALDEPQDPLVRLRRASAAIGRLFERADEPHPTINIERAVMDARLSEAEAAHLLVAVARHWGVPARLAIGFNVDAVAERGRVSGDGNQAGQSGPWAVWAEVCFPDIDWMPMDPVGSIGAGGGRAAAPARRVTLAIGRDAADLPKPKHVFKGEAAVDLTAAITIAPAETAETGGDEFSLDRQFMSIGSEGQPRRTRPAHLQAAQQQQQQQ